MLRIGAHCPISGGFEAALSVIKEAGGNTLQIFSGNPRSWKKSPLVSEEAQNFIRLSAEMDINPVIIHTTYLINLASPQPGLLKQSKETLLDEYLRAGMLGAKYLVLHPGSHTGTTHDDGIKKIIESILEITEKTASADVMLLLENTAGQGASLGSGLDDLVLIKSRLPDKNIGFCLDTAHSFAAGYTAKDILSHDFSEHVKVIHCNDSKTGFKSHVDRHAHTGDGMLGNEYFSSLMNSGLFRECPFIIETPWEDDKNLKSISYLKKLYKS